LYDHLSKPDQATSSAAPRAAKAAAVTIGAIMVAVVQKEKMLEKREIAQISGSRGVPWAYEGYQAGKPDYGPFPRLALSTIQRLVKTPGIHSNFLQYDACELPR
jgi:hypothetical protein